MKMELQQVGMEQVDEVAELFDAYRQFYDQKPDATLARRFIAERLERKESVILLARLDGRAAGFVQLYPCFSSVRARRTWVLNDLYVASWARRRGLARTLMAAAEKLGRDTGAASLNLETMPDNGPAQALYEELGWKRDGTYHYELTLD